MNTTVKMMMVAIAVIAVMGWLVYDSYRPVPQESHFDVQEYERVVVVGIDLSGSFLNLMADKGKAYEFLLRVLDRYMRGNGNEKLILLQLSGNSALLWDGTPTQLRKDFPDQETFRKYLLSKADPNASRLHDGIIESLEYLSILPSVTAKTKRAVLVLSDMEDNLSTAGSEQRLVQSLTKFGKQGGVVGIYFTSHHLVSRWQMQLQHAGIKQYVVESQIVTAPTLPSFD